MTFSITPDMDVEADPRGVVRHLSHLHEPYTSPAGRTPPSLRSLAHTYLLDVAGIYGIDTAMLSREREGPSEETHLEFAEQKSLMGTTTISYVQTYRNLPIWEAGFSVTMQDNPPRVTSSQSTVHLKVGLDEPTDGPGLTPEQATEEQVAELLGVKVEAARANKSQKQKRANVEEPVLLRINSTRSLIYRYEPALRFDPESAIKDDRPLSGAPPTLPLPDIPHTIHAGRHFIVTEVLFTLALPEWGELNWRAFIERYTGAVLYLRAFVACASGYVYVTDPITAAGGPPPTGSVAALDALRTLVELEDLKPQVGGNPVALDGRFIQVKDTEPPPDAPPSELFGHFLYHVNSDKFSAVNTYYHLDALFQLMEDMGFNVADYFDDTSFNPGFPLSADFRGFSDLVNAHALGNSTGTGSGGFGFGLAASGTTVGIADDARVVAHEFCHALLWDSVHSPNFGFAHSAGDSIGAILNDPGSQAPDRFVTFPWVNIGRRHDRGVAAGWAWGGINDVGGYSSEQILCTTLFRAYRSTGGDATSIVGQRYAARYLTYLIIRAIGSLATNPITPTPIPDLFATALMNADLGTAMFDDQPGGGCTKVIRWAFEQQGLYQAPGTVKPYTTVGAPPLVDVYINDGRHGEYSYTEKFWETTDIWNRHQPDGNGIHQTPVIGETNYAYVRVKNRGTLPASRVVVRGYHCRPAAGLVWPDDWTTMITDSITVPGTIPAGGQVVVGPFQWKPRFVGHESMLMSVSAQGDLANNDPATFFPSASGPTPIWRLVPFDNNMAQRGIIPIPGGGGRRRLMEAFRHRHFWVNNPFDRTARVEIQGVLPNFLSSRGWLISWDNPGAAGFSLGPRAERKIEPRLVDGRDFTVAEVLLAGRVAIEMHVFVDGLEVGGLTYILDPSMKKPAREFVEHEEEEEERYHHHEQGERPHQHEEEDEIDIRVHQENGERSHKVKVEIDPE